MRRRSGNDRAAHSKDRLRGLGRRGEVAGEKAYRDTMAGRLVFSDADGPERTGADLVDNSIAAAHAQAAREPLAPLRGRNRRWTRLNVSTHSAEVSSRLSIIIAGVGRQ